MIEDFQLLWQGDDAPPDVFGFLARHPDSNVAQRVAVLIQDQQYRWKTDTPLCVEDYLAKVPELANESQHVLDLVIGEFQARKSHDAPPDVSEYISRFPELSDQLKSSLLIRDMDVGDAYWQGLTQSLTTGSPSLGTPMIEGGDQAKLQADQTKKSENAAFTATKTYVTALKIGDHRRGRYLLTRTLGEGGFGHVYLALDEELRRQVAIKVPTAKRFRELASVESYLAEARTVASLDHANIVPVYDMGRTEDGSIYIVSKYIDGCTLTGLIGSDYPIEDLAEKMVAPIALALDCAHQKQVIHRDVKPSNILVENQTGIPYLADFGLAIREEDYLCEGRIVGTPSYMSPEQVRGEGHRLDGRSDVFSLGAVLYELITTNRPFQGGTVNEIYHRIIAVEPTRPRDINESIPVELERICLKALSKRASDRYATAAEFAEDLLHWRDGRQEDERQQQVVPKGLRSFDAGDAEFFVNLLPGPRNRHGLPECIHFWKSRIEETDDENTFAVGLVYGPSGCGKSSLVKAGLLPLLPSEVVTIYVEATPEETETRILRGMRKRLVELPKDFGLVEAFAWLRRRHGSKVLLVLDQFEQWLHAHRVDHDTDLVKALRQCDGGALQSLIMVRDDFAMAAARFFDKLDIPISQGKNFATVDLFDQDHAEKVLVKFGQAFGKLPEKTNRLAADEHDFVSSVAKGLASDGKVVPVRLALFAEMIKHKRWTPSTLDEVGGTQGIGVNFLEDTFSSRSANPSHRRHENAARKVLQTLLPDVGTDIKGHMRSQDELAVAAGYREQSMEFNELIRILDGELRLITPTDPEGVRTESGSSSATKFYQLTHDYLVQTLRVWLNRKQRETRRGRAELRLAERSAMWSAKPETRQLPSLWEYLSIVGLATRQKWTQAERQMMAMANRFYGLRFLLGCVVLIGIAASGIIIRQQIRDAGHRTRVSGLVDQLLIAEVTDVPEIAMLLESEPPRHLELARTIADDPSRPASDRLRCNFVLAKVTGDRASLLARDAMGSSLPMLRLIRNRLESLGDSLPEEVTDELWAVVRSDEGDQRRQLCAASLLAVTDPESDQWQQACPTVVNSTLAESPRDIDQWVTLLRPVARTLTPEWKKRFFDASTTTNDRAAASRALAQYADADLLCKLLLEARPEQSALLAPGIAIHEDQVAAVMNATVSDQLGTDGERVHSDRAMTNAIVTLFRLGRVTEIDLGLGRLSDATVRSKFILEVHDYGLAPDDLHAAFEKMADPVARQAVLLALEPYPAREFSNQTDEEFIQLLKHLARESPYATERSAAELLLCRRGHEQEIRVIKTELARPMAPASDVLDKRDWWVNSERHVMCVMHGPQHFDYGSPESEPGHNEKELLRHVTLSHDFAVSAHEVSIPQYLRFRPNAEFAYGTTVEEGLAANKVSLLDAMKYCRWLSEQEGVPEEQMCFPALDQIAVEDVFLDEEHRMRTGYRLLTEEEWECVCRAGTTTPWFTGNDALHLEHFAWGFSNSDDRPHAVGCQMPNPWGLFDVVGNMTEWCEAVENGGFVHRGGDFNKSAADFRSASRTTQSNTGYSFNGFRIGCTIVFEK